jgi:ABC-type multidrug transport system fused ATPase/permease subunit
MADKTVIVIAHRLSTLLNMDRILVFNNGVIVEEGSHEELLAREGIYTSLWNMQGSGFVTDEEEGTGE